MLYLIYFAFKLLNDLTDINEIAVADNLSIIWFQKVKKLSIIFSCSW
jgi:hypothetical protein